MARSCRVSRSRYLWSTLFCLATGICAPLAFPQVANDNSFSQMIFDRVIKDIIPPAMAAGGQSGLNYSELQINTVPTSFTEGAKYAIWTLSDFADTISPQGVIFKSTPNRFSRQYEVFIKACEIPKADSKLGPALQHAREEYVAKNKAYLDMLKQIDSDWADFHNSQVKNKVSEADQLSRNQWLALGEGDNLTAAEDDRDRYGQDWVSLSNQASAQYQVLAHSILAFDNIGNRVNATIPDTEDKRLILYYTADPTLQQFIKEAQSIQGAGHSWNYDAKSGWSTTETGGGGGSVSFFGVTVSGGGSSYKFESGGDAFGFTLEFKHWSRLRVKPGDWFNPALITNFKDGPFTKASRVSDPQRQLWSQKTGSMPWIISEIVVVYKPRIVIRMSHAHFMESRSQLGGSASVSIGPFSFGGSGGGSKQDIKWDESTNSLIAEGPDAPQILAVIQTTLPDFK